MISKPRLEGLKKIAIGAAAAVGIVAGAMFLPAILHITISNHVFIVLVLPFVSMAIGAFELTTGIPIAQLEARWKTLRPWQQNLVGFFIVAIVLVIAVFVAIFVVANFYHTGPI